MIIIMYRVNGKEALLKEWYISIMVIYTVSKYFDQILPYFAFSLFFQSIFLDQTFLAFDMM